MKKPEILFCIVLLITIPFLSGAQSSGKWKLVWSDEFNYEGLPDSTRWDYDTGGHGWGNNELQFYTESDTVSAKVTKGKLIITARKKSYEDSHFTSARLVTKGKGDWLYGKIEVKARLPRGKGMWPAIWMLPTDWKYGGWPDSGEIDIMENVGFNPDTIFNSVHTKAFNHTIGTQKTTGKAIQDVQGKFHTYSIEWFKDRIDFFIDGKKTFTFTNSGKGVEEWPFDQRFHLLLNIAVGGNWGGQQGVDEAAFPASMEVDYVRVYQ